MIDQTFHPAALVIAPKPRPAEVPPALRGIGPALIVLAGFFQWLGWWQHQAPFVPLVVPTASTSVYMGICIMGLLLVARASGRHPAWCAYGLLPLGGPLLGLAALVRRSTHARPEPRLLVPLWAKIVNVLLFVFLGLLGLAFLGFFIAFQNIQVSKYSPDRSARVVVHGRMDAAVYAQEIRGLFLTADRRVLWAGDLAQVTRAVWSKDGSRFLLIGADSDTTGDDKVPLPNAEGWHDSLFVMYDRPSGILWFNSIYRRGHPPFTLEDARAIEWAEPGFDEQIRAEPAPATPPVARRSPMVKPGQGGQAAINPAT